MGEHCETCKWWEDYREDAEPGEPAWGNCTLAMASFGKPLNQDTLAYAHSGELVDFLMTREDFGCVQWEAKGGA